MSQPAAVTQNAVKTPAYAWVVLFALYMATLSATLDLFKVPPIMGTLIGTFGLSNSQAGLLMSIFSIMGFVLAIPAGYILMRFGIKMTGLIAVGAVIIGSSLGAMATATAPNMLFFGRFVEGIGMGLIMVTAPFAISVWFPLQNRALPTGLGEQRRNRQHRHSSYRPGLDAALQLASRVVGLRRVFGAVFHPIRPPVPLA
ncbi:MAG: transporter [Acidobacteria bacterium]|nr:transporter [Acidobacteriota bacterium]